MIQRGDCTTYHINKINKYSATRKEGQRTPILSYLSRIDAPNPAMTGGTIDAIIKNYVSEHLRRAHDRHYNVQVPVQTYSDLAQLINLQSAK